MNIRGVLLAVVAATLVAACATRHPGFARGVPFNPENPRVYVVDGKQIVVDQEPVYITKKNATIVWELPKDQKLTFPADGIVVKAERGEFNCKVEEGATRFSCVLEGARTRTAYKYTIKVLQDGKDIRPLDPIILTDF